MPTDFLTLLQQFLEPWLLFLADDPLLRLLQGGLVLAGTTVIFLVFYTPRDILLRTHSFFYMLISILLVALLPVIGFFLYLLIRPARTVKERELEMLVLRHIAAHEAKTPSTRKKVPRKKPTKKKSSAA